MRTNAGHYHFVHACPGSTYEDMRALIATERRVSLPTFRHAIGLEQWIELQEGLGYDRHLPISKDRVIGFYKGTYRQVPAYFVRHSGTEYIFTLNGELGPSHARHR